MSVIWTSVALLEIPGGSGVRSLDLTTHTSLSPIRPGFKPGFVNYKKGRTRLAVACDKVYHLFAHAYDMVDGNSLQILRLPPPLKLVATI